MESIGLRDTEKYGRGVFALHDMKEEEFIEEVTCHCDSKEGMEKDEGFRFNELYFLVGRR